jgi:hypothetical protein
MTVLTNQYPSGYLHTTPCIGLSFSILVPKCPTENLSSWGEAVRVELSLSLAGIHLEEVASPHQGTGIRMFTGAGNQTKKEWCPLLPVPYVVLSLLLLFE